MTIEKNIIFFNKNIPIGIKNKTQVQIKCHLDRPHIAEALAEAYRSGIEKSLR